MSSTMTRPLLVGAVAAAVDMFVMKEENMQRSMIFGGAVAAGSYASEFVGPLIHHIPIPTLARNLYEGKTLVTRIAEVSSSTAMVYVLNKYVLQNDPYRNEMLTRVGIIAFSDVAGTYLDEYLNTQPLQFFTNNH